MGILSGPEIRRQVELGNIQISPFDPARLGPNSYDLALGPTLLKLDDTVLDLGHEPLFTSSFEIPLSGFYLEKGIGYLAHTVERICCNGFVPWVDGRSTLGRYFVQAHQTAGRGDDGFDGTFTMELCAIHRPVRVYARMPIFQVSFFQLVGERQPYQGRYTEQTGPRLPKSLKR